MRVSILTEAESRTLASYMRVVKDHLEESLYETENSYPDLYAELLADRIVINQLAQRLEALK